jgi:stearoyl-CoA 9-desaturase NADPH oxidoreductase
MFTETLVQRVLGSSLVDLLTGPHGVDRYTELVQPTWTLATARARVLAVRRATTRSVTLTLEPNAAFPGFRAGQHVIVDLEINGRRHTRCYSPASAEGNRLLELTIGRHESGVVSNYLYDHARPGMVFGLDSVGGHFVLPVDRPDRIVLISGGSGITPVISMLRTLRAEGYGGEITFLHYARSASDVCYRDELAAMPGVTVRYGYTRSPGGDVTGHFEPGHLTAGDATHAVYVCGPPALVDAVRQTCPTAVSESFVPPVFVVPDTPSGGRVTFTDSAVDVVDDGRSLLDQAEAAGLSPESGCRMGICHTCTRRKTKGAVRNLTTGALSTVDCEDVQICVSAPVGDVELAL